MASGDWKAQFGRILGTAVKAGAVAAVRNLTRGRSGSSGPSGTTGGRSSTGSGTSRTSGTSRSAGTSGSAGTRQTPGTSRTAPATERRSPAGPGPGTSGAATSTRSRPSGQTDLDDFPGVPVMEYSPRDDGLPDPGEIVWTWVPFEEDHSQGKDRPVLIVGRDGELLLGLMLTSKDHDRDAAQEARYGRHWTDIGTGDWDAQRRPSEIRVDRVLRVDPSAVRREGAVLDRERFDAVAREVARVKG